MPRGNHRAVKIAKASARGSKGKIKLASTPTVKGNFSNKIQKDPFDVPLEDASDLLLSAAKAVKENCPDVNTASASIFSFSENKYIATSEGSQVFQKSIGCGPSVSAVSFTKTVKLFDDPIPGSFGWNIKMQGYENIEDADLVTKRQKGGGRYHETRESQKMPSRKI